MIVEFDAELWLWDARRDETWTFVSLPVEDAAEIRDLTADQPRGFGSVRVRASIGSSTWTTSIFPDSAHGTYVLPVKKAIRTAQKLTPGDRITVTVELVDL